jgi:hypothetical protein
MTPTPRRTPASELTSDDDHMIYYDSHNDILAEAHACTKHLGKKERVAI